LRSPPCVKSSIWWPIVFQYLRVVQRTRLAQLSEDSGVPRSRLARIELQKTDCTLHDGILISAALGVRFSDILRYAEDEIIPVGKAPWVGGRQSPSVRFVLEMEPFEYDHGHRHNYATRDIQHKNYDRTER
jgi:hypothetical protein